MDPQQWKSRVLTTGPPGNSLHRISAKGHFLLLSFSLSLWLFYFHVLIQVDRGLSIFIRLNFLKCRFSWSETEEYQQLHVVQPDIILQAFGAHYLIQYSRMSCEAYQSSPRYQWGLWSSERLSNLSQNTQQTCHWTETKTQILLMPFPRHHGPGYGAPQETSHPQWGWRRLLCGASATQARIGPPYGLPGVGGWEIVVSFG